MFNGYLIDLNNGHVLLNDKRTGSSYDVYEDFESLKDKAVLCGWRDKDCYFLLGFTVSSDIVKEINVYRNDACEITDVRFILQKPIDFVISEYENNSDLLSVMNDVLGVSVNSIEQRYNWGCIYPDLELMPTFGSIPAKDLPCCCKEIVVRYGGK